MVDAKAHLLTVQTKTVTTPQWWMLRPTDISFCDNATLVDAKAHLLTVQTKNRDNVTTPQ